MITQINIAYVYFISLLHYKEEINIIWVFWFIRNDNERNNNHHEQYYKTLFLRKTSNNDLVANVSGNHPGTLISKFFWADLCAKISSNLLTKA